MKVLRVVLLLATIIIFGICDVVESADKEFDSIDQVPLIPRAVFFNNPEKMCVHISPDGQRLAYLAPYKGAMNIWVKTIGEENDLPITELKSSIREFCWSYNNLNILFIKDNNADECFHVYKIDINGKEIVDMTPFDEANASIHSLNKKYPNQVLITLSKKGQKGSDMYRLELQSGEMKVIARNLGNTDVWCADTTLQVRGAVVAEEDGTTTLLVRKDDNSPWEKKETWRFEDSLVGSVPPEGSRPVGFSQDGCTIYLIESKNVDTKRLVTMNLVTGEKEILSFDDRYDVDSVVMNPITHEPDLVCFQKERKEWKVVRPDLKKDIETVLSVDTGELLSIDRSADDKHWIICFRHDTGPCSYWLYDRPSQKLNFLFCGNKSIANYALAVTTPISFTSRDGLTIHGYLTCPPLRYKQKLPLILVVHAGPWARDVWGYDINNAKVQLLANRGYACLQINFRGSTGYGKAFLNAGNRQWAGSMHNDLVDAATWAIQSGIANKDKIAIYGESYGGYAALVGATFTPEIFCCAVDLYGPSNLITFVRSIVGFRPLGKIKWYKRVGNPETEESFLQSCSPLFKVYNIKTPVFIAQGANDVRVKQEESEQMVAAMKKNGIEYEYMLFPGEGHGFTMPQNRLKVAIGKREIFGKASWRPV